jgi:TolA-binding protein
MALELDIKTAIEKNLSAEVGAVLKTRLTKADVDADAVTELNKQVVKLQNQVDNLQKQVKKQEAIEQRIQQAEIAEKALRERQTDSKIVELKMKHAEERVFDMKSIVMAVFQNNQFKYTNVENGSLPAGCDQYGNPRTTGYNRTSTGTGEGAPPPPPVGSP